ncbi:MAG: hypothetical protein QGG40_05875 [Myxococcota bacterium]|jgi:hypothetical protein|nr:hypothetical protein [Myxococcota bacterium]
MSDQKRDVSREGQSSTASSSVRAGGDGRLADPAPPPQESELRAKDILAELEPRCSRQGGLTERVGHRGWGRPKVATSRRLFERLGIADPWDPDSRDGPVGLGSVALKLGERRQPAPHARPPAKFGAPTKPGAPGWRPRVPDAAPTRTPKGESRESPGPPRVSRTEDSRRLSGEFGGTGVQPLRAPLPVRPDLGGADRSAVRSRSTTDPAPGAEEPAGQKESTNPPGAGSAAGGRPVRKGGRFSARATQVQSPRVWQVPSVVEGGEEVAPEAPERPVPRRSLPSDGSLDDLFGVASQGGRLKRTSGPSDETDG